MEYLKWQTYDRRYLTVKEMTNDHLLNVTYHIIKLNLSKKMLDQCFKELKHRDIDFNKLKECPIVFKDSNGYDLVWDYEINNIKKVS